MPNIQQSNAPSQCPCSKSCIATMHLTVHTPHPQGPKTIVSEVNVCSSALDEITRALRLLPDVHWDAEKLMPRAIPMPQAQPDDRTRPVTFALDHASELTSPMNTNTDIPVAVDAEVSDVYDTGLSTPLPLLDDPTTNAIADRPLPSVAHRVFVLKRLVEAFDAAVGFRGGDISIDRKVSFDEDLAKSGARHQTMTLPVGKSTFAGKMHNARVDVVKGSAILHVYRFEEFAPWLEGVAVDGFRLITSYLDQLDESLHAGAFKFLRLVASEAAKRPPLFKTAYFEFI
jgi:hypothetical protein